MAVGLTVTDELIATGCPFNVALAALVVVQLIVVDPPAVRDVELAFTLAVGAGALEAEVKRHAPMSVVPDWGRGLSRKSVATPGSARPAPRAGEDACNL